MISLVMATYNGEKYLEKQLESIRMQTRQPDEVIICDDCSTDSTRKLIKNFIKKYGLTSWQLYLNEANKGYSRNFSDAMKKANGDIIFLADQDDIWLPDKISAMTEIMERNKHITLLASNVEPFYCGETPQKVNLESFLSSKNLIKFTSKGRWIKPARPGCSMCFKSLLLDKYYSLWFEKYPHDCLLWGVAILSEGAYLYNKTTLRFRRHDSNASSRNSYSKNKRIDILLNEEDIINRMIEFQLKQKNFDLVDFLNKQKNVYRKRIIALKEKNPFKILLLLPAIKYFGRPRFLITDIYYCLI